LPPCNYGHFDVTLGAAKARKLAYRHFMIDDSWLCEGAFLFLLFCFSCYFGADTQMNHMENCAIIANKNVYEPVTCYPMPAMTSLHRPVI